MRRRVLRESILAILVLVILGALAFSAALDRILFSLAEEDARGQATELAGQLSSGRRALADIKLEMGSHGSIIHVVDARHRVLAESNPTPHVVAPPDPVGPGQTAGTVKVELPIDGGSDWAVVGERATLAGQRIDVVVAAPLQGESHTVHETVLWLLGSAVVVLVIVVFLIQRSVEAALRPVRLITSEVDRIHPAGGSDRVTVPATSDEIAELATMMNQMLDRLESADHVTRDFLSNASHELRSPLTTMRVLLENEVEGASTSNRDQIMHGEVLRMQRLVEDIVTLAKADDARLDLRTDEVDLDGVVHSEVARLRAATTLRITAGIDAARVIGDEGRLTQALRNLADNALRHAGSHVDIRLVAEPAEAVIYLDNDGPLVPAIDRDRIFSRFVRLEPTRPRAEGDQGGGTGLGLTICRSLIEAHGGRVFATSSPDGLCRFEVHLPRVYSCPSSEAAISQ